MIRLANNRLEANPNSDRMTAKRKVRCGRQFSRLHSRVARAAASITGCRANVHTPQPVSAMASEAMPETVMEYRFICVNGLKRICLFSMVLCMIVSALMGSARKMTADSSTSFGLVKEAGYQRGTAHQHSIQQDTHSQIEPEDGTELFCSRLFLLNECGTESAVQYDIGNCAEKWQASLPAHSLQRRVYWLRGYRQ